MLGNRLTRYGVVITLATIPIACDSDRDGAAPQDLEIDSMREPLTPAEERRAQLNLENAIAECMLDEGFEYYIVIDGNNDDATINMSPEEFAEQYGYGYTLEARRSLTGPIEAPDPNATYLASLDPVQQGAYTGALEGSGQEVSTSDPDTTDDRHAGCRAIALRSTASTLVLDDQTMERLDESLRQVADHPSVQAASEEWSDCMFDIDPNYELADPQDAVTYYERIRSSLLDSIAIPAGGAPAPQPLGLEPLLPSDTTVTPSELESSFRTLQAEELALYAADMLCQEQSHYRAIVEDVRREMLADAGG